jgi:hypothetical protein
VWNPFGGLWPWDARKRAGEAVALARQSYIVRKTEDGVAVWTDLRRMQEMLAHTPETGGSVVGSAAVGFLIGAGTEHIRTRGEAAQEELIRAAETHGARPTVAALEAAWDQFIEPGLIALRPMIVESLMPHVADMSIDKIVDQSFEAAVIVRREAAKTAFAHFVAAQNRDRRTSRWNASGRLGWAVVGVLVVKAADFLIARIPH